MVEKFLGHFDFPEDSYSIYNTPTPIKQYIQEISKIPLLTAEQEVSLFRQMEAEVNTSIRYENGKEIYRIPTRETYACRKLVESNLRLVVSEAKKYVGRGLPLLDLIQEGNLGLMHSIKKFDYHRGFKLSTYAIWWINQHITRAIVDSSRTIRIPVHINERLVRMDKIQHSLTKEDQYPTDQQTAKEMGITLEEVRQLRVYMLLQPISLEQPVDDKEETTLRDGIPDTDSVSPEDQVIKLRLIDATTKLLEGSLTPRERMVLELRFGIGDGRERTLREIEGELKKIKKRATQIDLDGRLRTLQEVGNQLGLTRERVRQIETEGLAKLRTKLNEPEARPLREYLLT